MKRRRVPPRITPAQVAEATGWTTEHARGVLRRAGILEEDGPHRFAVSRAKLQARLVDVYEDVYSHFVLDGD